MADLYEIAGVPRDADEAAIKAAKRKIARDHHPDKPGGDEKEFKRKMGAITILANPESRAHYDRTGEEGGNPSKQQNPLYTILVQAFDHALVEAMKGGLGQVDIPKAMRDHLNSKADEGEAAQEQVKEANAVLEEVRSRLAFEGDGDDVLGSTIRSRLEQNERSFADNAERIALYRAAVGYAEAWKYRVDPKPATPDFESIFRSAGFAAAPGGFVRFNIDPGGRPGPRPFLREKDDSGDG